MLEATTCLICGGELKLFMTGTTTGEQYFTSGADYGIAGGDYEQRLPVYTCQQCGHGLTVHGVTSAVLIAWYAQHSLDTIFLADEAGRRRTARRVLERIAKLKGSAGRLLDVGAGPGLFLSEAKNMGWQVAGIEPAASSRAYAAQHFNLTLEAGGVDQLAAVEPRSYDVVTLFDVIEHVVDPIAVLCLVTRALVPGGLVVITTPRFDSLAARLLGKRWYSIFPAHLHFFTHQSLTRALKAAGFVPLATRSHLRHLSIGYVWQRLRGWLGSTQAAAGGGQFIVPFSVGDEFEVYARTK